MPDYGPRKNSEGYSDPTAYEAMSKIQRDEIAQQKRVAELVNVLKYIIDKAGFDLLSRIEIRDRRTGKDFR